MTDVYDPTLHVNITEGTAPRGVSLIKKTVKDALPNFLRYVVLDCISDPHVIDDNKLSYWEHVLGVSNFSIAKVLPRNTIIAKKVLDNFTRFSQPMFLFPFFPSHLAMPCKPGEIVWVMFENPAAKQKEIGYWFCRITEPHFIDDVNHTHHPRQLDSSFVESKKDSVVGNEKPIYDLTNGKVSRDSSGERFVEPESAVIQGDEFAFEKIIVNSDAVKMMQYEAVPRFRKRPGDVALEGSNNSLIVLGTDRTSSAVYYDPNDPNNSTTGFIKNLEESSPDTFSNPDMNGYAGSIDIVTGRGTLPSTGGVEVDTESLTNPYDPFKKELGKSKKEVVPDEGNPDLINDRSRVLLSQRTMVDKNFGIDSYNSQFGISDDSNGDAAIVIKSDKVRIIARSDISFIVTNFSQVPPLGGKPGFKQDGTDANAYASITIKQNGDIVFSPSTEGYVKLGGDAADRAILCSQFPATTTDGTVSSLPIATTAGGFVGTDGGSNVDTDAVARKKVPDLGSFSKKVLIM